MNEYIKKCVDKGFLDYISKNRVKCQCGHSLEMFSRSTICNWCGRKVYRSKKDEFKEKLERKMR